MTKVSQQDKLITFLLDGSEVNHHKFNQILVTNKNNMQLSIIFMRDFIRSNTSRGKVCLQELESAFGQSDVDELNLLLNELFLDVICEDMCRHTKEILVKKSISYKEFHNAHLKRVEKPLARILSSL